MQQKHQIKDLKIVTIDDCHISQMAIYHHLEKINLSSKQIYNGEEALNALKNEEFHLVLLDIELPKYRGIRLIEDIRNLEKHKGHKSKIFITTTYPASEKQELCFSIGADEYLTKSIHFKDLSFLLKKHFYFSNEREMYKEINHD